MFLSHKYSYYDCVNFSYICVSWLTVPKRRCQGSRWAISHCSSAKFPSIQLRLIQLLVVGTNWFFWHLDHRIKVAKNVKCLHLNSYLNTSRSLIGTWGKLFEHLCNSSLKLSLRELLQMFCTPLAQKWSFRGGTMVPLEKWWMQFLVSYISLRLHCWQSQESTSNVRSQRVRVR